ncbi:unnamed protein product, partial [Ectocarpus sp. 12 AP-2014]
LTDIILSSRPKTADTNTLLDRMQGGLSGSAQSILSPLCFHVRLACSKGLRKQPTATLPILMPRALTGETTHKTHDISTLTSTTLCHHAVQQKAHIRTQHAQSPPHSLQQNEERFGAAISTVSSRSKAKWGDYGMALPRDENIAVNTMLFDLVNDLSKHFLLSGVEEQNSTMDGNQYL